MQIIESVKIPPGINNLVDVLYNEHFVNNLTYKTMDEHRTMMMLILMFYMTVFNSKNKQKWYIKLVLVKLLKDPNNRQKCIELYKTFESSYNIKSIQNTKYKIQK